MPVVGARNFAFGKSYDDTMRRTGDILMKRSVLIMLAVFLCCSGITSAQNRLGHLSSWAGRYPTYRQGKVTKRFLQLPEIRRPLLKLLSKSDFNLLTRGYAVETPIKQIGDFLALKVCRAHNCSAEQASFAINLLSGTIYVRMFADEKTRWFSSRGKYTDTPQSVQDYLDDFSAT